MSLRVLTSMESHALSAFFQVASTLIKSRIQSMPASSTKDHLIKATKAMLMQNECASFNVNFIMSSMVLISFVSSPQTCMDQTTATSQSQAMSLLHSSDGALSLRLVKSLQYGAQVSRFASSATRLTSLACFSGLPLTQQSQLRSHFLLWQKQSSQLLS